MIVIRSGDGRPLFRDAADSCYVTAELLDLAGAGGCEAVTVEGDLLAVTTAGGDRRYLVGPLVGGLVHELDPV
jgi:hypothetical protein